MTSTADMRWVDGRLRPITKAIGKTWAEPTAARLWSSTNSRRPRPPESDTDDVKGPDPDDRKEVAAEEEAEVPSPTNSIPSLWLVA